MSCGPLGGFGYDVYTNGGLNGNWGTNSQVSHNAAQAAYNAQLSNAVTADAIYGTKSTTYSDYTRKPVESAGLKVGEIVGWRMWGVRGEYLQSYSAGRTWSPHEPVTGEPTDMNDAGVWAFKDRDRAVHKMLSGSKTAYGSVAMWGTIIEHSLGYRAEFAKILTIDDIHIPHGLKWFDDTKKRVLRGLQEKYGVTA